MISHNDLVICGLINGNIKFYDTAASSPVIRLKAFRIIEAHKISVQCMDTHGRTLASAAREPTFRNCC